MVTIRELSSCLLSVSPLVIVNITRLPLINDEAGEVLGVVSLRSLVGRASHDDIDSISA